MATIEIEHDAGIYIVTARFESNGRVTRYLVDTATTYDQAQSIARQAPKNIEAYLNSAWLD